MALLTSQVLLDVADRFDYAIELGRRVLPGKRKSGRKKKDSLSGRAAYFLFRKIE